MKYVRIELARYARERAGLEHGAFQGKTMRGDGIRRRRNRGNAWWISWTGFDGKRHRRKARRQSFAGAKRELARELDRVQEARETGFAPLSFKEVGAKYLEVQKSLVTDKEYERQTAIIDKHLRPFFACKLAAISREAVEAYIAARSQKVSSGTVRKEVGVLKHMLNYAVDHRLITSNSASRVKMPKPPAGRVRYLQPSELLAVLERCSPEIRAIAKLAVATGMRRGEILGLRWMDVDLLNRCINLPQTKNGEGRTVYMNELALDVFRNLWPDTETVAEEPVFGLDVTPEEVSMSFMRACREAGVVDFSFHDLRHTCASWLRQKGVQLDVIAKQLGHRDLRMTSRYAHLASSQVSDAVNSLNSILSNLKATEAKTRPKEKSRSLLN